MGDGFDPVGSGFRVTVGEGLSKPCCGVALEFGFLDVFEPLARKVGASDGDFGNNGVDGFVFGFSCWGVLKGMKRGVGIVPSDAFDEADDPIVDLACVFEVFDCGCSSGGVCGGPG